MKEIHSYDLKKMIAKDFNLPMYKEVTLKLPNYKHAIKRFVTGCAHQVRIFDGETEHPFMIGQSKRNDEMLSKGRELRYLVERSVCDISKDAGKAVKTERCKISEGNGWYSEGTKYTYKDFCCEV